MACGRDRLTFLGHSTVLVDLTTGGGGAGGDQSPSARTRAPAFRPGRACLRRPGWRRVSLSRWRRDCPQHDQNSERGVPCRSTRRDGRLRLWVYDKRDGRALPCQLVGCSRRRLLGQRPSSYRGRVPCLAGSCAGVQGGQPVTPELGRDAAPTAHGWIAFYRLQARLMWEWRPTRLAILRRAILSFLGACLALAITVGVVPGLQVDGLAPLLLAGLILLALDSTLAVVLHGLLVGWPIFIAQLLGVVAQFAAIIALGRVLPGIHVGDTTAAVWGAIFLTVLNSLFAELVAVSDDDSYYSVLVRRLVAREFRHPKEAQAGLLVGQIDGLSLPVLREAIRAGRVPVLGRMVRSGEATLHPWIAMLPPTTPASQGGILHGNNDGIAGFRWYEKATGKLLVANHPEDAAEIVDRISDGRGLLANDGAGIGNLVTGDAPRSYLTMATIDRKAPSDDARRLRGFFVTTVNYIRLLVLMAGEVVKELYQAERQRGWAVEPRMHRDLHFAIERAATNIALRTVSTALVIEEMYSGAPTIYVDYTGYDAIAHHCGPERPEAIDALEGIDRAIGSLLKAARFTGRPSRMVMLSR